MTSLQKPNRGDREYDHVMSAEYKLVAEKLTINTRTAV